MCLCDVHEIVRISWGVRVRVCLCSVCACVHVRVFRACMCVRACVYVRCDFCVHVHVHVACVNYVFALVRVRVHIRARVYACGKYASESVCVCLRARLCVWDAVSACTFTCDVHGSACLYL